MDKNKAPCPQCGTKDSKGDNLRLHKNGSRHCYACDYHVASGDEKAITSTGIQKDSEAPQFIEGGEYLDIEGRGILAETCKLYNYTQATWYGKQVHVETIYNPDGSILNQKLRLPDKTFPWLGFNGDLPCPLFGQHIEWDYMKPLVITEGAIDAMTVYQLGYQAVSIKRGSKGTERDLKDNIEWLSKFEKIVVFFDLDTPGQDAVEVAKSILPLGKTFIVVKDWGYHDANDSYTNGDMDSIKKAIQEAKEVIPEGIVFGDQIKFNELTKADPVGLIIPFNDLNEMIRGLKKSRFIVVAAGTGTGKSSFLKEWVYSWLTMYPSLRVANIFLEEEQRYTLQSYVALHHNIPTYKIAEQPDIIPDIEGEARKLLGRNNIAFLDHFGSLNSNKLLSLLEYLAVVKKMGVILLDHISIAVSGLESSREGERKDIDILVTKLKSLTVRTGTIIVAVSHLTRPKGVGFEEGLPVTLNALRGSGALGQIPDVIMSLERNQQHSLDKTKTLIRVLKNRITGKLGEAQTVYFNEDTGRLETLQQMIGHKRPVEE